MLQLIADKTQTLKSFTDERYAQGSFFFAQLLKNKDIKVNGVRVNKDVTLKAGDLVCYYTNKKQEERSAFYTVYEDENVLVVDKENGVNAEAVYAALARKGEYYFIHRLDRNTQGLMVFARNSKTEQALLSAFKEKRVEKIYHALCFGDFSKETEIMTAYLKKDSESSIVKIYDEQMPSSEKIITEYEVLEKKEGVTKVEITLHTGKTHQIRAHFAHIRRPIVGDMKYGNTAKNRELNATRQCLIAKKLRFDLTGEYAYLNEKIFVSRYDF